MVVAKQEIAEVNRETNPFALERGPDLLIHRELHSTGDRIVLVDPQHGRSDEDLMGFRPWDRHSAADHAVRSLSGDFEEAAPVPERIVLAQHGRPKSIDRAVSEDMGSAIAVVFKEAGVTGTKPQIVTS